MKEVNLARSINYAVSQAVVKPRESNVDPDRPFFAYIKTSELPKNEQFPMRPLFSDAEKNPNGFIIKEMYQFPDELDLESAWMPKHKCRFKMVPGCYKAGAKDFMLGFYDRLNTLLNGPTNYNFTPDPDEKLAKEGHGTLTLKDGETEPTRSDIFRDLLMTNKELKTFIQVISKQWIQVIIPVLLYATADVKKDGQYDRFSNYQPDEDEQEILPRLIQFNYTKDLQESLLDKFVEKSGDPAVNDLVKGRSILYTRKDKGHSFSFGKKTAFDEDWEAKFAGNPDYYPNLRERELGKSFDPEGVEAALKACPKKYLQPLIDFGVLDVD